MQPGGSRSSPAGDEEAPTPIDRRRLASIAALVSGLMALGYGLFAQGGFYPRQFRWLLLLLAVGTVVGLVAVPPQRSDLQRPLVALSGSLFVWSVCSAFAAGSIRGAAPVLGLLGCIAALSLMVDRLTPADRSVFEAGVLALGLLAGLYGWYGVAWHHRPAALTDQGLWRAASPITYANGTAGLLVPLAVFSLARTIDGRSVTIGERVLRSLITYLLFCGAAATMSRAGGLGFVAGLIVVVLFGNVRRLARTGGPILVAVAIAFLALLPSTPDNSRSRPTLALLGLILGGALVLLAALPTGPVGRVVVALVAVAAVGLAVTHNSDFSRAVRRVRSVRLTATSTDRIDEWHATWRLIRDRPVIGIGPGQFLLVYESPRGATLTERYAHNEYLQLFAEEGGVGLVLLAGGLVLVTARLLGAWRRGRPEATGALAALGAIAVHSAFDFLWHIPAVLLLPLALICLALTPE